MKTRLWLWMLGVGLCAVFPVRGHAGVPLASDAGGFVTAFVYTPGGTSYSPDIRARGAAKFWKRGGVARSAFILSGPADIRFALGLPVGAALVVDGKEVYRAARDERLPDGAVTPVARFGAGLHGVEVVLPAADDRWPGPGFFLRILDAAGHPLRVPGVHPGLPEDAEPRPQDAGARDAGVAPVDGGAPSVTWVLSSRKVDLAAAVTADVGLGFRSAASGPDVPVWRVTVRAGPQLPSAVVGQVPVCLLGSEAWPVEIGTCALGPGAQCAFEVPWIGPGRGGVRAEVALGPGCRTRVRRSPRVAADVVAAAIELRGELATRDERYDAVRFDLQLFEDLATTQVRPYLPRTGAAEVAARLRAWRTALHGAIGWRPGYNLRAYRSPLDGRFQPYVVVLPADFANDQSLEASGGGPPAGPRRAMVVGLHGHAGTPWSMCRALVPEGTLPSDMIAVCPFGYGDLAFRYAGRRDLFDVLTRVRAELAVDLGRVHLVGVSDGGLAAFEIGLDHPAVFASVVALAAGGDMRSYPSIGAGGHALWETRWLDAVSPVERAATASPHVDWLIVYGGRDRFPGAARRMAAALRGAGADVELREHADAGHDVWSRTFARGAHFAWMAPRKKKSNEGVAPSKTGTYIDAADGTVGCSPGPETLDRVRDLPTVHVYATGDPAQTALYRYLAQLDSDRWGRRVHLNRRVISDASLTSTPTQFVDHSVVLVGTPRAHAGIRRLVPNVDDLLAGVGDDVGLRSLLRPNQGVARGCPRVLVLATGTSARGVSFANHLPEILPARVWTGAAGVIPPFGQVLGQRTFIRAE